MEDEEEDIGVGAQEGKGREGRKTKLGEVGLGGGERRFSDLISPELKYVSND